MTPPLRIRRSIRGFSLIELSIVMAILSIVAVMGLESAGLFMSSTAYQKTQDRLNTIKIAMAKHRYVYGYLPCPAGNLLPTDSNYGKEVRSGTACASPTVLTGSAGAAIIYGDLPVRDLELPLSYMKDGYGSKFRYVVTQGLTVAGSPAAGISDTYGTTNGSITIRTGKLEGTCSTLCQDITSGTDKAAYVVLSFGADQRGAYNGPSCATGSYASMIDSANCQFNTGITLSPVIALGIFYDSRYNNGSVPASHFDDLILWQTKSQL